MYNRLSQAILVTLGVFTGAVALSMASSGTLSDIGFFVYAAALVLLAVLAVAWLIVRLRLRTARRRSDATTS
jgi:cation transporter-like permease